MLKTPWLLLPQYTGVLLRALYKLQASPCLRHFRCVASPQWRFYRSSNRVHDSPPSYVPQLLHPCPPWEVRFSGPPGNGISARLPSFHRLFVLCSRAADGRRRPALGQCRWLPARMQSRKGDVACAGPSRRVPVGDLRPGVVWEVPPATGRATPSLGLSLAPAGG
jgi:hypothetical protein